MQHLKPKIENFKLGDPASILIRGTNGTGKSTIIRNFIPAGSNLKHFEDLNCPYYDCGTHYVVGRYESDCGGLDAVRGNEQWKGYYAGQEAIRRLSSEKTTFAEGILASSTFEGTFNTVQALADVGVPTFWFSIDIPIEQALESVLIRRLRNGNKEPMQTVNVAAKYRTVPATHNKALEAGVWAFRGGREEVLEAIKAVLEGKQATKAQRSPFDMEKVNAVKRLWDMEGKMIEPTAEQIDKHYPKPTTYGLAGFFC